MNPYRFIAGVNAESESQRNACRRLHESRVRDRILEVIHTEIDLTEDLVEARLVTA